MMDKNQLMRYSTSDLELLGQLLNEVTALKFRDHFLQLEQYPDKLSEDAIYLLKKAFTPELVKDVPLCQEASAYSRLVDLDKLNPDVGFLHIQSNDVVAQYLAQQIASLSGGTETLKLTDLIKETKDEFGNVEKDKRVTNLMAFNFIVPFVEGRLFGLLKLLEKPVVETPEQKAIREAKDSAK